MQELGYPWVVRKALMKYGAKSTDIVRHKSSLMTVTTVNAKGSWTRTMDTEKTLQQVSSQQFPSPALMLASDRTTDSTLSALRCLISFLASSMTAVGHKPDTKSMEHLDRQFSRDNHVLEKQMQCI